MYSPPFFHCWLTELATAIPGIRIDLQERQLKSVYDQAVREGIHPSEQLLKVVENAESSPIWENALFLASEQAVPPCLPTVEDELVVELPGGWPVIWAPNSHSIALLAFDFKAAVDEISKGQLPDRAAALLKKLEAELVGTTPNIVVVQHLASEALCTLRGPGWASQRISRVLRQLCGA